MDIITKISNYNFLRFISFFYTIVLWGSKRGRRGTTYGLLLDLFVLVVVRRVNSTVVVPSQWLLFKPHWPTIYNILKYTSYCSQDYRTRKCNLYDEDCKKGGAYSIYKALYCLVVFEGGKEEHVHCELEHEKLLSQVMARKKWQMGSPANQDVFNSQELLLCKATDVALRGYLHFTRFFHLHKVYQI